MCFELRASVTSWITEGAIHIRLDIIFYKYFGFLVDPLNCIAVIYIRKIQEKNHYFNIVSISLHCTQLTSFQHMPSIVTIGTFTYNMYRAYLLPKLALGI